MSSKWFICSLALMVVHAIKPRCNLSWLAVREYVLPYGTWTVPFKVQWNSGVNNTCETWVMEESIAGHQKIIDEKTCKNGHLCFFSSGRLNCEVGRPKYHFLRIYIRDCWCQYSTVKFSIAHIQSSKGICERAFRPQQGISQLENTVYKECGQHITCTEIVNSIGPGCYCKEGYRLSIHSGDCQKASECPSARPTKLLDLSVHRTINLNERAVVSWTVNQENEYEYVITNSQNEIVKSDHLLGQTDELKGFKVNGNIGQLILPKAVITVEDTYSVTVTTSEKVSFVVESEPLHGSIRIAFPLKQSNALSGALQVYANWWKAWALICSRHWSPANTQVVCRQLGSKDNGEAVLTSTPIYASLSSIERDYEIFFHILQCNGSESNIFDCVTDMRIVGVCKSNNILQINCKGSQISSGISPTPESSLMPTSTSSQTGQMGLLAVISVLGVFIIGGLVLFIITCLECKRRRRKHAASSLHHMRMQFRTNHPPSLRHEINRSCTQLQMFDCLPQKADTWELQRSDFQLESNIGSGKWGTVFKGILNFTASSEPVNRYKMQMMTQGKSTNIVAIKELKDINSRDDAEAFLAEIEMMKRVSEGKNSHVVKMVGCVTLSIPLALILEYVPQGNLRDYLRTAKTTHGIVLVTQDKCPITEDVAIVEDQDIATEQTNDTCETDSIVGRHNSIEGMHTDPDQHVKEDGKCNVKENDLMSFASQIANGMQYLSSLGVIHRDLACRNILVDDTEVLKIADFGLARNTEEYMSSMKDKLPIRWMAPETFVSGTFTEKSDVWSFGVCLWEIFSLGALPYKDIDNAAIVPRIVMGYRLQQPYMCPDNVYAIIMQCCHDNPDKRPTFATLRSTFECFVTSGTDADYIHLEVDQ